MKRALITVLFSLAACGGESLEPGSYSLSIVTEPDGFNFSERSAEFVMDEAGQFSGYACSTGPTCLSRPEVTLTEGSLTSEQLSDLTGLLNDADALTRAKGPAGTCLDSGVTEFVVTTKAGASNLFAYDSCGSDDVALDAVLAITLGAVAER